LRCPGREGDKEGRAADAVEGGSPTPRRPPTPAVAKEDGQRWATKELTRWYGDAGRRKKGRGCEREVERGGRGWKAAAPAIAGLVRGGWAAEWGLGSPSVENEPGLIYKKFFK
jgi:hypothetical protein